MRRLGRTRWALCGLLLLGGLSAITGCQAEPPPPDIVRPVRAMRVQKATDLDNRWFPGRAKATQEVNLAFEVPGQLIERPVKVGDRVKKGQVLARIDPRDYENRLAAEEATREETKAQYERIQIAVQSGAVSRQDLDDAKALYQAAEARVRIAEKAVEDTVIRAKFDGTIAATYVENYQNVLAKQRVLRLLDVSRIEMWVNIPEGLISYADRVEDLRVRFDAFPGREIPARLLEVGAEASQTTRTYPVNFVMDQPDDITILPGMAGEVNGKIRGLVSETEFEIPIAALGTDDNQKSFLWVVDEGSGLVSRRAVEVKQTTARGVMVSGVKVGEWVATAGVRTLREGQKVRFLDPARGDS